MNKPFLTLRIDREVKLRITEAARRVGKSVTTFVVEATMRSVEEIESAPPPSTQRATIVGGACPSFFKGLCYTAQAGGKSDYAAAGHELTRDLHSLAPYEIDRDEWEERVRELDRLLRAKSRPPGLIMDWFTRNVPRCADLVPKRRHAKFVEGVIAFYDVHGLDLR